MQICVTWPQWVKQMSWGERSKTPLFIHRQNGSFLQTHQCFPVSINVQNEELWFSRINLFTPRHNVTIVICIVVNDVKNGWQIKKRHVASYWWWVNGLVASGTKPLPQSIVIKIYITHIVALPGHQIIDLSFIKNHWTWNSWQPVPLVVVYVDYNSHVYYQVHAYFILPRMLWQFVNEI